MYIHDLTKYKNVAFVGDVHGRLRTLEYYIDDVIKLEDTCIVVCGDIGLGFNSENKDHDDLVNFGKKMEAHGNVACLFRGNHDNPERFRDTPWARFVETETPGVVLVNDWTILKTAEGDILVVGGARSIDRSNRALNYSWWEGEDVQPAGSEFWDQFNEYEGAGGDIKIVCTHTAPSFCAPLGNGPVVSDWAKYDKTLIADNEAERQYLENLWENLKNAGHSVDYWFYGHFHNHFDGTNENTHFIGLDMVYTNPTGGKQIADCYMIRSFE